MNIFSTGFDYPEIDLIVQARPTASLVLFYQQIGRGLRIHPDKKNCLIIDLVGNVEKFGKIEDLTIRNVKGWGAYSGTKLLTGVQMIKEGI